MQFANRHCPRCGGVTRQEVSCRVSANDAKHYGWWCLECNHWTLAKNGGNWIAKELLLGNGIDPSALRVTERTEQPRCVRCGARGAEIHHWAPQAIFGTDEANRWPKDFLCKSCHDEWHRRVTPQLVTGSF